MLENNKFNLFNLNLCEYDAFMPRNSISKRTEPKQRKHKNGQFSGGIY